MDCTTCGAPLPAKSNLCVYCSRLNETDLRALRQASTEGGLVQRPCPRCQESLRAIGLGVVDNRLEIDRCDHCFGIFFDPGELESILDSRTQYLNQIDHQRIQTLLDEETPRETAEQIRYVPCPECRKLMNRKAFGARSGVIIDHCRDHGIWLDGGELKRLLQWTHAGGRLHHQQRQEERAAEERRLEQRTKQAAEGSTSTLNPRDFPSATEDRRSPLIEILTWLVDLVTDLR